MACKSSPLRYIDTLLGFLKKKKEKKSACKMQLWHKIKIKLQMESEETTSILTVYV